MNTKQNNESRTRLWVFLFLGLLGGYGLTTQPVVAAPFAYVTVENNSGGTVSVIDTATNTVGATIVVGDFPVGVAITPRWPARLCDERELRRRLGDRYGH